MGRKPKKKAWSKIVEESGVRIRLYERPNSSAVWYSVTHDGKKTRRSLKTTDRELAERRARSVARGVAELDLTGGAPRGLTLGHLRKLYLHHRGPLLSTTRGRYMKTILGLLVDHLGEDYRVEDFGQHQADAYVQARETGRVQPDDRRAADSPSAGTIRNELQAFSTVCNWASRFRTSGRPLLGFNPVRGLTLPREENPSRPVATEARYRALLEVADQVDDEGRLRTLLILAWETGRRINAILHLRASDVLLNPDQLRRALAEEGQDESLADVWETGLRWRPEWDKVGYLDFSPLSRAAREALEAFVRSRAVVGEGWLFPANDDRSQALTKAMADYYLRRAEKLAGLPRPKRGGWHAFRRAWATRRKHLPVQDVMAAGGWRDVSALQAAYQQADPETIRKVMEVG